jgi:hypothetical protein
MKRDEKPRIGTAVLVAVGLVPATLISALGRESGWLVAAGPLTFALVLVIAYRRRSPLDAASFRHTLMVAGAFVTACGIIALRDPALLGIAVPVLGGGAFAPLLLSSSRSGCATVRRGDPHADQAE